MFNRKARKIRELTQSEVWWERVARRLAQECDRLRAENHSLTTRTPGNVWEIPARERR